MPSRVRVYMGCSADGFIAGLDQDLSFLERAQLDEEGKIPPQGEDEDSIQYEDFIKEVGVILMGRNTYDFVAGLDIPWPYGDLSVLVLSHRALEPASPHVQRIEGDIQAAIARAKQVAGDKDVYLDGGALVRLGLEAGLVDELIITMVPILLGQGVPLFAGLSQEHPLTFTQVGRFNQNSIQWIATPRSK